MRGSSTRISDYFSIDLADGAAPAPPGGENTGDGAMTWAAGSAVRAPSMGVSVRDMDVGANATVFAPYGLVLEASRKVAIGPGAVLYSANNGAAITGDADVLVGSGARLIADRGVVSLTAREDLTLLPGSSVRAGQDTELRAGGAAMLNASTLASSMKVVVAAPTCTATNVTASAPLVQVCD